MTKLDSFTIQHMQAWCDNQFPDSDVFILMKNHLESMESDEIGYELNRGYWKIYDSMKAKGVL